MAKLIGSPIQNPDKSHMVFLTLEKENGERVEVLARKAKHDSLTTVAKRLAYALECAEYHSADGPGWSLKRQNRRALWDADDKAKADAKFTMRNPRLIDGLVAVDVTHHGLSTTVKVANDPANAEANVRAAFATYEANVKAEKQALAAFNVG